MCALRRISHAVYDLNCRFVWIPKHRKVILVGDVAEYSQEVFERIGEVYSLMINRVEV